MRRFIKELWVAISLIFKKSSQIIPPSKDTENLVVQKQQDNYYAETKEKSFRQLQYEKLGIKDKPYIEWEMGTLDLKNVDWGKQILPEEIKRKLEEWKMTEEQFEQFRKNLETKTGKL